MDDLGTCTVCRQINSRACKACRLEHYCGREHQREDWPRHKLQTCRAPPEVSRVEGEVRARAHQRGCELHARYILFPPVVKIGRYAFIDFKLGIRVTEAQGSVLVHFISFQCSSIDRYGTLTLSNNKIGNVMKLKTRALLPKRSILPRPLMLSFQL